MRKILLATVAVMVLSVTAFAVDGVISNVKVVSNGKVFISLLKTDGTTIVKEVVGDADNKKRMLAAALTAKTGSANVTMTTATINGTNGWNSLGQ